MFSVFSEISDEALDAVFCKHGGHAAVERGNVVVYFDFGEVDGEVHIPHLGSLSGFVTNLRRLIDDISANRSKYMEFDGFRSAHSEKRFLALLSLVLPDIIRVLSDELASYRPEAPWWGDAPVCRTKTVGRGRKESRNNFFRKEKFNPNNCRRHRDYIDDADFAMAHVDAVLKDGEFENNQCHCSLVAAWTDFCDVVDIHVVDKINNGESVVRLRQYLRGWREDFRSSCDISWRPSYYKYHKKNVSGMKRLANKRVRHAARLFMRDCDGLEIWDEEIAPTAHGWFKKAFETYDILGT